MELGLALPTYGSTAAPETIVRVAESAERIGLASIWTFERLLRPLGPAAMVGTDQKMPLPDDYANVYEPLETLSYVAARTSTIRLATSVIDAPFHAPVILARRLATLDRFSGGRLTVGLGQGWMVDEFTAAGVSPKLRGAGFAEHVEAMRAAWGPDPVRFEGRFYTIPESQVGPKPVQPGGPPLLAGAVAPAAIERAAHLGIGYNPVLMSWDMLRDGIETFRRAAEGAGHDPGSLPIVIRVNGSITAKPLDERAPLTGSVDQVIEDLARAGALGATETLWAMDSEPDEQLAVMEQLHAQTKA